MLLQKLKGQLTDIATGSTGGFVSLETVGDLTTNATDSNPETALQNGIIAIIVGLITTGIKDLFKKIFKSKKDKPEIKKHN